jgi:hypothetical protein
MPTISPKHGLPVNVSSRAHAPQAELAHSA